jgi:peptidoglycan/xylan/chitin deacetylase (PgdA/CDA1 family)
MRYLTISWDDGFARSMLKLASIYEKFGLKAEINVLATAHEKNSRLPEMMAEDAPWGAPYGDFGLWNELQARGHVIQPHGLDHTDKTSIPLAQAQEKILRCLEIFTRELKSFDARQAIFNFPYNASTPELEAWLPSVVRAFRGGPGPALNPLPKPGTVAIRTGGWEDAEPWLEKTLADLLAAPEGWLVYNAHGLDGEGWGPLRSEFLERTLEHLLQHTDVVILPAREVLGEKKGA